MGLRSWRVRRAFSGRWKWLTGTLLAVLVLLLAASYLAGEPLRRYIEHQMNERMDGYTASIRALRFHLVGISWDLKDVVVVQDANPDPPVLRIKTLSANVQWWALLHGRLVSDFSLVEPVVYVNREQLVKEATDEVPVDKRGWQDALQAAHPFKVNEFKIVDGDVTYVDTGQARPLRLTRINALAHDIRNVRSAPGTYPSPLHLDAVIFESGKLLVDGDADFFGEPHAGVKGRIDLERVALDYFKPVLARYNFELKRGVLTGRGNVEYSPTVKVVDLDEVRLDNFDGSYVHRKGTAAEETTKAAARKTAEVAKDVSNKPDTLIRVRELTAKDSTFGFVNADVSPQYRVFIANTDISVRNFSNHRTEGTATAALRGRFMGTGETVVQATFRPETHGPDFDVDIKIENTDMRRMNDLLRAHGKIDVASGVFSFYSQLAVKNGRINGYVKPLFRDLDVYAKEQDQDKKLLAKFKEKAIDAAAKLFKNRRRDEVATRATIAGSVENPKASTWQVLVNVLRNAFVKAILPGFDREVARLRKA